MKDTREEWKREEDELTNEKRCPLPDADEVARWGQKWKRTLN